MRSAAFEYTPRNPEAAIPHRVVAEQLGTVNKTWLEV